MMLYGEFVGLSSEPVENTVEKGAVRKFAEAIGDSNLFYGDEAYARQGHYGRLLAPPTFPRTFDCGYVPGLELPDAGLIHGEFHIFYERPLYVGDEVLCSLKLKNSYDKESRNGLLGFLFFERIGETRDGERIFTMNDTVIVTEAVRKVVES